jgi:hypothetical protein
MTLNPQAAPDGQHIVAVDKAEVISADASGPSGTEHAIVVSPEHTAQNKPALVMENAGGDVTLPTEGEDVLIGQTDSGTFYVLGRTYQPDDTVPTLAPGERRIGHPLSDSAVTLHKDGTVTIEGDSGTTVSIKPNGDVVINGGSTAPITDVQTSTDGDGHVTSIDITRAEGVFVPSQ